MNTCFNCFNDTNGYDVCPYCGFVAGTKNMPEFMLQPGIKIWNRYIIGTILGIGGFGVTYKAFDIRLGVVVAIKEYFPQNISSRMPGELVIKMFTGEDSKSFLLHKQRFVQEGKNLAKFTGDAHIVNVLDNFEDNGTAYIVMEYLDGQTLKDYLQSKKQSGEILSNEEAVNILKGILQGLASIHKQGIIHRDISPDNIYILNTKEVKLLDFGAARFAAKEDWTQSVVVKKGYAPPEQYRSNMRQSEQTDLYAAGATFYKMLTGITPEESIERWEKDVLVRPSKLSDSLDVQLDKFTMKAIALKPEMRFKSAENMLLALEGKTNFDYPEKELKRRKTKKALAIALSIFMLLVVALVITLPMATQSGGVLPNIVIAEETLADKDIQPDTITLMINQYNAAKPAYYKLAEEFMAQYPEHKVEIVEYDYESENTDYDITFVQRNYKENANLSLLINGLNEDNYVLSFNDEMMPIAISPSGYYIFSEEKQNLQGIEIIDSLDDFFTVQKATMASTYLWASFAVMEMFNGELYDYETNEPNIDVWESSIRDYIKTYALNQVAIYNITNTSQYTNDRLLNTSELNEEIILRRNTLAKPFELMPIANIEDERLAGSLLTASVNINSDENKQLVAMQFIHFMLSEKGQTVLCVQGNAGMPVNNNVMEEYLKIYPEAQPFLPYLNYRTYYLGTGYGNAFNDGIAAFEKQTIDAVIYELEFEGETLQDFENYYDENIAQNGILKDIEDDVVEFVKNYDIENAYN